MLLDKRLSPKNVDLIIFNNPVKSERILIILAKKSWWNLARACEIVARHYAMLSTAYLKHVTATLWKADLFHWLKLYLFYKNGRLWRQPLCCMAIRISGKQHHCLLHWYMLPVFQPLINRIIHHPMIALNPGLNMPLPQLVRIPNWRLAFAVLHHILYTVIHRI